MDFLENKGQIKRDYGMDLKKIKDGLKENMG